MLYRLEMIQYAVISNSLYYQYVHYILFLSLFIIILCNIRIMGLSILRSYKMYLHQHIEYLITHCA